MIETIPPSSHITRETQVQESITSVEKKKSRKFIC